jgi:hypothetical protein
MPGTTGGWASGARAHNHETTAHRVVPPAAREESVAKPAFTCAPCESLCQQLPGSGGSHGLHVLPVRPLNPLQPAPLLKA